MDVIEPLPWALPVAALAVLLAVVTQGAVARRLAVSRGLAMALVVSSGVIVAATLTPLKLAIESGVAGSGRCDLSRLGAPSMEELAFSGASDIIPNVFLFVPLGLAVGLAPNSRHKLVLILVAVAAPVLIEVTQLLVPALARGCESADVVDNLMGLALGYAIAVVLHGSYIKLSGHRQQPANDESGVA